MTSTEQTNDRASADTDPSVDPADLRAEGVVWDLDTLLDGRDADWWLERAEEAVEVAAAARGTVADMDAAALGTFMERIATVHDAVGRAGNHVSLRFATDTTDEAAGAAMQRVEERATAIGNRLVFFELEWAELDDGHVDELLVDERLQFCEHHLRSMRRFRTHLLSEPEEQLLADKSVTGASAWARLFSELTSTIEVALPDDDANEGDESADSAGDADAVADGNAPISLEEALSYLQHPDRDLRRRVAGAVSEALSPGLRTRAYIFNTLLADKSVDDRHRRYDSWLAERNLQNEASDSSVAALTEAVVARYEIARRWYRLKAAILGVDRIADYDRMASVSSSERRFGWSEAREIVLDAYHSFSPELGEGAGLFFDRRWIDAPVRPGKRPGAFCAYTVPAHHPYVFLNWTGRSTDVLTLAHELGHGLHAYLARPQGVFHQTTPLTVAETASVFGETVTFGRLLDATDDANERLDLLARSVEGSLATVFRQIAMNRFEDAVHTERRESGELATERFAELWAETQGDLFGDAVELTPGYRTWWSYIPHFIHTPGYVYAYAYGQLLALSVYRRYTEQGPSFVPRYLEMLAAGGSLPPEELGRLVDCDLEDPAFWDAGLELISEQVDAAEEAARAAGRL
ncbi:MAG: M3 family oligoendopeptidase [Acidimicrobiia bacterium]|nr:M3 family oligoendopeptidase [Acidimicrobiia bacterium]